MTWPTVALGELTRPGIGNFVDGPFGSNLKASEYQNTGVPIIRLQNIRPHEFLEKDIKFISSTKAAALARHDYGPGDLVIAKLGEPTGVACLIPPSMAPGRIVADVVRFRGNPQRVDHAFLSRFLNSPAARSQLEKGTTGTTRKRINLSKLKSVRVPLPPLGQQKRIAAILDSADALRAKRRASIEHLDALVRSTFLEMFGDPVMNPKGFPVKPLEAVSDVINDCPHSTPRWVNEGVVCLRTSNLGKGEWIWQDTRFVTEQEYRSRSSRGEVAAGDIILSREGTVGVMAVVAPAMRLCMGQRLVQVRVSQTNASTLYVLHRLLHDLAPHRITHAMAGSTSRHLNVKDLRKLPIAIPSLPLQQRFAAIVESIEHQKTRLKAHLAELDTLFASLQSRAFTGAL